MPGGFGDRGVEGKILAANYARVNKIPYLGICLGMQVSHLTIILNSFEDRSFFSDVVANGYFILRLLLLNMLATSSAGPRLTPKSLTKRLKSPWSFTCLKFLAST